MMLLSYARVSTVRQGSEEKFSLPEQLRKNRAVAQMRGVGRFDVVEYVDKGISGAMAFTKRPEGSRLWSEMRPGDVVVASKLDRMFRSAADALNMLERFREKEVDVILLDIGVEPIAKSAMAEAFFGMLAIFANLERRMINERTAVGKAGKRAKGGHCGGKTPYGWRVEGEGKTAILVPEEGEQKVVTFICERMARRMTGRGIIGDLVAVGHKTRDGRRFQYTQIRRIYDYEMKRQEALSATV